MTLSKLVATTEDKVVFLSMGGTILCEKTPGGLVPAADPEKLVRNALGREHRNKNIAVKVVENLDSSRMRWDEEFKLLREIYKLLLDTTTQAIIVTTGTDTMEVLAFFLALLTNTSKPIILTGAQRSADHESPDGPRNIREAYLAAINPGAIHKGVSIVFNGKILPARFVKKMDTARLDTFDSPYGPIGHILHKKQVEYYSENKVRHFAMPHALFPTNIMLADFFNGILEMPRIRTINVGIEEDMIAIRSAITDGVEVIILNAYGAGNVNDAAYEEIKRSSDKAIFLLATQCEAGKVEGAYGSPGGGATLANLGVVFTGDLRSNKIRTLAALYLAQPEITKLSVAEKREALRTLFEKFDESCPD